MNYAPLIVFAHIGKDGETIRALLDTTLIAVCLVNDTGTQIIMKDGKGSAIQAENSFDDVVAAIATARKSIDGIAIAKDTAELCERKLIVTPKFVVQ